MHLSSESWQVLCLPEAWDWVPRHWLFPLLCSLVLYLLANRVESVLFTRSGLGRRGAQPAPELPLACCRALDMSLISLHSLSAPVKGCQVGCQPPGAWKL